MSGESIKNFWNSFADEYERSAVDVTTQVFHQMLTFINLNACDSVLEAGCGTGFGLEILRNSIPQSCHLTGSDYSPVMVQKSQARNIVNCSVLQEDNQSLSFANNSFDTYLANLSLHLVPDPASMLSEAYRVLKPLGTAVFSVWGKPEDTNLFIIMNNAERLIGVSTNPKTSPFHLNDQDRLNQMLKDAGFNNVKSFYTVCLVNVKTGEEFVNLYKYSPGYSQIELNSPEKYQELLNTLKNEADNILNSGRLITFEALIAIGEKPEIKIKTTNEVREYWNEFANSYERHFLKTTLQINTLLIPLLKLRNEDVIAEVGCGTGTGAEIILHYYPSITKILANDISEPMIQKAQSKNLANTEFVIANNETLPYNSASCDKYVSNLSLQIVENPELMVNEAFRVLKPNGIAVFSVWGKKETNNLFQIIGKAFVNAGGVPRQERSNFHLGDQEKMNKLLNDAGFVNVKSFFTASPVLIDCVEDLLEMNDSRPETQKIKENLPDLYAKFVSELREEYRKITASGNYFTFDALVAVGEKHS